MQFRKGDYAIVIRESGMHNLKKGTLVIIDSRPRDWEKNEVKVRPIKIQNYWQSIAPSNLWKLQKYKARRILMEQAI